MITESMQKSINHQINRELYSAYLYLSMAAYAADCGLNGIAHWFEVQAKEEMSHAQKFYNYVNQQGGRVVLEAIEAPPEEYDSILETFEKTFEHEKKVTQLIHDLVDLAKKENDTATEIFLQWFVTEQVEEEATAMELMQKLKLVGPAGSGLFMFDKDLAGRTFTPPAQDA